MKKLLKISLVPFLAFTSFSLVACQNASSKEIKIQHQKTFQEKIDPHLKELVSKFFQNNQAEINSFYTLESQTNKLLFPEVLNSLIFAPLWDVDVYDNSGYSKSKQTFQSIKNIREILHQKWFWALNNIDKLVFVYNPYGADYNYYPFENNEAQKETIKTKIANGEVLKEIKNPQILDSFEFELTNDKFDIYTNKKLKFLKFDANLFIPLLEFESEQKLNYFLFPELLELKNNEQESETFTEFVSIFNKQREKRDAENIQYYKELNASENENESSFDSDEYLKNNNDKVIFDVYTKKNYAELFKRTIEELKQNQNIEITKYTWGYLNEK
ncbi:aromatic motif membrane protein [Mycoplasmopsis glycophila]|uniref:Lipoprotein n=1 Tax=Mycoplasmopsis glycophila TaxID=171285 RepID=A0A449AVW0_9BACT|nr:aromatic motif membrane protein [Mycoplasmopsis glycophila]VEU70786.1 Uncharacterised protein [Mycoplasmopsis glycophila]